MESIDRMPVGFISFPKIRTTANPFSFLLAYKTNSSICSSLPTKLTDAPSLPEENFINCWYFLSFNIKSTLAFSTSNCALFLSFNLNAKIFILSNDCSACFCWIDNFDLSRFKIVGETSNAIKSLCSVCSTKYFCKEGLELQPVNKSIAVTRKKNTVFIIVLFLTFCTFRAFGCSLQIIAARDSHLIGQN